MNAEKIRPELNEEQRAAAFCAKNAVVAAGAGSGKTTVLASRYAWLITEKNCRVDEILSLTFTKKAAAQMYRRIHSMLGEIYFGGSGLASQTGPVSQACLVSQALDDFIHARIQTLDSYSASLVKQAAPRYGISPDFTIDEERCRDIALEEALPFLIAHRHHPAIERLYPQKRPEAIAYDIFAEVIFKYSHIDEAPALTGGLEKQFGIICAEWEKQCVNIKSKLRKMADLIAANGALLPDLIPLMGQFHSGKVVFPDTAEIKIYFNFLLAAFSNEKKSQGGCIAAAESHPIQAAIMLLLEFMDEINSLDLRRGKRSDNPVKEIIKQLREPVFAEFSSLAVYCMQAGLIVSIMFLLSELQRRYLNRKRTEGVLTFSDVARLARTILLEQEDIRQSEKEAFKAVMIDEFQDNNELQKDLLFLLAEKPELKNKSVPPAEDISPDKLFFVGDEKQSIYRFRGADVSVFRKLKDELKSGELPLKTNYRSAPLLIGAFNAIFGGGGFDPEGKKPLSETPAIFAPAGPDLPLYEASYTPLRAGRESEGKLTLCIFNKKSGDESEGKETELLAPVENEARFVAERIRQLLEEKDDEGKAKYLPDDIAILFRARSPQDLFEKHLRLLNIPYAGEDLNGFFFGGPVNDIMSVLRLAAYPLDRAAYAEMLRSPFAGLSLPGLAACLAFFNKAESAEPFTDDPISDLTEEDRVKYRQGQQIYRQILDKAGQESVSSLVSELWYAQGYRYEIEWNPQTSVYRELYDYLFHLAAQADADNQGLAAFTDSIQALRNSGKRLSDIEIPLERPSAVHLLTVHKSKGLEFPVVFLCCCDKHSQRSGGGDVYDSGATGIVFNPPLPPRCSAIPGLRRSFFWERSLAEDKRKRTAELRRLLYVGMTRAEKELFLTGCLAIEKTEDSSAEDFSLELKAFIDKKREKAAGKNTIPGDAVLDNDTFFGLCLPALGEYISPRGLASEPSFFQLEEIPAYTRKHIDQWENSRAALSPSLSLLLSNDQNGLNAFFEKTESFYQAAEIIHSPSVRNDHLSPVSLRKRDAKAEDDSAAWDFVISKEFSGEDSGDVFGKVDAMLTRFRERNGADEEKFSFEDFGTIAHVCAGALLNGEEAEIPPKLAGPLSPVEAGAFLEAGRELAVRFLRSPLGKIARNAGLRENEFPFRSMVKDPSGDDVFISGTIDLLFEDENSVHVVDFKTDSRENPTDHVAQMACYFQAASTLFAAPAQKECRIWLYYLRTGHAVEISEKAKQFDLVNAVSRQPA
jgi:ATP-dependent helicase/nuclease subunit A